MTSDLGVPAYTAYLPAPQGQPARICGWGASLSRRYAVTRAVSELVQLHSTMHLREQYAHLLPEQRDDTGPYPKLHACYLSDFTSALASAELRAYEDTVAPGTPRGHLDRLLSPHRGVRSPRSRTRRPLRRRANCRRSAGSRR
ncbi:YcaO-like family protein [Streptomyces sp. NPDC127068]|uniref:YcaO-like family protein n=1 Tax=Streptomyces sp. NPDC127068 TaxID=3347127 RepID=UPI003650B662